MAWTDVAWTEFAWTDVVWRNVEWTNVTGPFARVPRQRLNYMMLLVVDLLTTLGLFK